MQKWAVAEKRGRTTMPSLIKYAWPCLKVILEVANNQEKINYGELADRLGLHLAQQEWNTVLDSVAWRTKRDLGNDIDLTLIVVYASGRAKGLGRYFSNGKAPGSAEDLRLPLSYGEMSRSRLQHRVEGVDHPFNPFS
jgi:hypothetical protein